MHSLAMNIIYEKWGKLVHIYTDGSKDQQKNTSAAVYIPKYDIKISKRLTPISIFKAEQVAIIMALECIKDKNIKRSVIFCDSLSVLCDLKELNQSHKTIEIRHLLHNLREQEVQVFFEWIPSHCGIAGNETVDSLAKSALEQQTKTEIPLNRNEMNNMISIYYMEEWQLQWVNSQRGRFLFHLQPTIKPTFQSNLLCRRDESIIHRLRVGSCMLNETLFKLNKHNNGKCSHCDVPETVQHFLLDCGAYREHRNELQRNLGLATLSIRNILNNKEQRYIIRYVKNAGKYNSI